MMIIVVIHLAWDVDRYTVDDDDMFITCSDEMIECVMVYSTSPLLNVCALYPFLLSFITLSTYIFILLSIECSVYLS